MGSDTPRHPPRPAHFLAAAEAVAEIAQGLRPADTVVADIQRRLRSGSRDRAQISALAYGVLRNFFGLRAALGEAATPLELCVAHALLNRWQVPPLREVDTAQLEQRLQSAPAPSVAARHNLPDWLWDRLERQFGATAPALASALNQESSVHLRVNSLRGTRDQARELLAAEGVAAQPTPRSPWGLRLERRTALHTLASFRDGWYEPQDEGSQLLAAMLDPGPDESVADFCAGAGGKTLALACLMQGGGELQAFDSSASRLQRMDGRLARAGIRHVSRQVLEPNAPLPTALAGRFDAVLVDAPCSGTGTLRRHPELRLREPDLPALQATQVEILRRAATLVRPGGRLLYATCSLLREENEAVTEAFCAEHRAFSAGDELRLLPDRDGTDGYYALMLRRARLPE